VKLEVAIARFEGENSAVNAYSAVKTGQASAPRWTSEVGFVEHHHNGRLLLRGTFAGHYLDVDESEHISETGAGAGALAGGLVGALLGPAGIALGLVVGGAAGSQASDASVAEAEPRALAERLRATVPRSSSALVLIASPEDVTDMLVAVGESATGVLREHLTDEQSAQLQASLGAAPPVTPAP
jgi:uncharacterized membrane protein